MEFGRQHGRHAYTSKTKGQKKQKKSGKTCTCANKFVFKKIGIELHFAKIKFYWAFLIQKSHISNFHHSTNHIYFDFNDIKFQNKSIFLNYFETEAFYYIICKFRTNAHLLEIPKNNPIY